MADPLIWPAITQGGFPAHALVQWIVSNFWLHIWLVIGFTGQAIFTARFLVQWIVSEKKRDSVVPVGFWWLSLAGGVTLLSYAIHRRDPVIIVGQGLGLFVYTRNLMLVAKGKRRAARRRPGPTEPSDEAAPIAGPHAGRSRKTNAQM